MYNNKQTSYPPPHPNTQGARQIFTIITNRLDDLVGSWSFIFWQHLRSYHDMYQLVREHTHGDFIVVPLGNHDPICHSIMYYSDTEPTSPCLILLLPGVRLGSDKYQLCKSLAWPRWDSNSPTNSDTTNLCMRHRGPCAILPQSYALFGIHYHV